MELKRTPSRKGSHPEQSPFERRRRPKPRRWSGEFNVVQYVNELQENFTAIFHALREIALREILTQGQDAGKTQLQMTNIFASLSSYQPRLSVPPTENATPEVKLSSAAMPLDDLEIQLQRGLSVRLDSLFAIWMHQVSDLAPQKNPDDARKISQIKGLMGICQNHLMPLGIKTNIANYLKQLNSIAISGEGEKTPAEIKNRQATRFIAISPTPPMPIYDCAKLYQAHASDKEASSLVTRVVDGIHNYLNPLIWEIDRQADNLSSENNIKKIFASMQCMLLIAAEGIGFLTKLSLLDKSTTSVDELAVTELRALINRKFCGKVTIDFFSQINQWLNQAKKLKPNISPEMATDLLDKIYFVKYLIDQSTAISIPAVYLTHLKIALISLHDVARQHQASISSILQLPASSAFFKLLDDTDAQLMGTFTPEELAVVQEAFPRKSIEIKSIPQPSRSAEIGPVSSSRVKPPFRRPPPPPGRQLPPAPPQAQPSSILVAADRASLSVAAAASDDKPLAPLQDVPTPAPKAHADFAGRFSGLGLRPSRPLPTPPNKRPQPQAQPSVEGDNSGDGATPVKPP